MKVSRINRFSGSGGSVLRNDAVEGSYATAGWPKADPKAIRAIREKGPGLVDLWEASPVRIESNVPQTERFVDALYPGNPLLCCALLRHDSRTRPRENWYKLDQLQFMVPNPMTARTGKTQTGRISERTLANTGPMRFLVIDQDSGDIDQQAAILLHLAKIAPMALAMHSGGKSLHGWFYCGGISEEHARKFMEYAVSLGADPAMWTRCQLARMPDGIRDCEKRQSVYFFNPEVVR